MERSFSQIFLIKPIYMNVNYGRKICMEPKIIDREKNYRIYEPFIL